MIQPNIYTTLRGEVFILSDLDDEERELVDDLIDRARTHPDWNDFDNYSLNRLAELYDGRGIPRPESRRTPAFLIARDLSARIGIEAGLVRMPDYRDELEDLILNEFKNRREFCEKTGISEDMLSHVLAGRKQLSMDKLTEALARIGRTLRIVPMQVKSDLSARQ